MSEQRIKPAEQDRAMAYLALQLGKMGGTAVGEPPSDEELAALSEQSLGDVRYAQVLSHIASNSKIYHRWMRIGESIAMLNNKDVALKRVAAADNASMIHRLGSWLFSTKGGMGVFGGGLATAAVLVLAVILLPSLQQPGGSLDQQYDYWKPYISSHWDSTAVQDKYQAQGGESRAFFFPSQYQKIFRYGFQQGAGELGLNHYSQLGISVKAANTEPPLATRDIKQDQYKALMSLGKLTALTTLQCEMDVKAKQFEPLYHTAQLLSAKLYTVDDEKISQWAKTLGRQSDTTAQMQALCRFSGDAVRKLL